MVRETGSLGDDGSKTELTVNHTDVAPPEQTHKPRLRLRPKDGRPKVRSTLPVGYTRDSRDSHLHGTPLVLRMTDLSHEVVGGVGNRVVVN